MKRRLSPRSKHNLVGVHPALVDLVYFSLDKTPYDFGVIDGVRTLEKQKEYVEKGVSQTMNSRHLTQADGYGHAVDLAVWVGSRLSWEYPVYLENAKVIKEVAEELGINVTWGGDWTTFVDAPHWQLEI